MRHVFKCEYKFKAFGLFICLISFIQRADIALADLTMNKDRMEAVDFSVPFMNTGKSSRHLKIASTGSRIYSNSEKKVIKKVQFSSLFKGVSILYTKSGQIANGIYSVEDLLRHNKTNIRFGWVQGGTTDQFLSVIIMVV